MYKSCSKCGKIHNASYQCKSIRVYSGGEERNLRSSYSWTKKAKEIKERSQHLCSVCRDKGIYTYSNLEVHHIEKVRDNKELFLDDDNLICLCIEHHKQADSGQISKEYLRKLAKQRDES